MTIETKMAGMFGAVTAPDGNTSLNPASVSHKESGARSKQLVDEDSLPAEYKEAVGADDFVIYGKASVEQYDEDKQKVDVSALEKAADQLYKSGNISRRHKDVRVGEVAPEWKLSEDATMEVGGETMEFKAGDTLATGANPDVVQERRSGEPDDDEFWLVAKLWNDTEIAKDTRLRSMSGDLNGFSVTIYAKEVQPTEKGERVTDVDWHAVTIGSDDAIKNKESQYDLAGFKARFGGGRSAVAGAVRDTMFDNLLKKSADEAGFNGDLVAAASKATQKAQEDDDVDLKGAAEAVSADADFKSDDVLNAVNVMQADSKASDDLAEVLAGVENGDLSAEEALELVGDAGGEPGEPDEGGPEEEMKEADDEEPPADEEEDEAPPVPGDEDEEDEDDEPDFEEKLAEHGVVTEEKLDEKLSDHGDAVAEKMTDLVEGTVPDAGEIAEKMETGSTESPSAGTGNDARNIAEEVRNSFGGDGDN